MQALIQIFNTSMYQNTYSALSNMLVMSSCVALGFYLLKNYRAKLYGTPRPHDPG